MLAADLPEGERLIDDPFAHLVVDDAAVAAARADEPLQNVIRLRTRYIDDAVRGFVATQADGRPQVLLLGAGLDARAYRMTLDARVFEVDFPDVLAHKAEVLAGASPATPRTAVPVDLASSRFVEPLVAAGFQTARPTIVVWEGVINYLSAETAERVVEQVAELLSPGGQLVADYAEMAWFKGSDFERATKTISTQLRDGGEPLRAGLRDVHGTLDRYCFDLVDDEAIELLRPRYGLSARQRVYPARMVTAVRRG